MEIFTGFISGQGVVGILFTIVLIRCSMLHQTSFFPSIRLISPLSLCALRIARSLLVNFCLISKETFLVAASWSGDSQAWAGVVMGGRPKPLMRAIRVAIHASFKGRLVGSLFLSMTKYSN